MLKHRSVLFASIGVLIFVAGTLIGRAQQPRSDFEITVEAPGTMTATCVHGCQFNWSKPIGNDLRSIIGRTDTISFGCPGAEGTVCKTTLSGIVVPLQKRTSGE